MDLGVAHFDWYQATIRDEDDRRVVAWMDRHMREFYDGETIQEAGRGFNSYSDRVAWKDPSVKDGKALCTVQWGGYAKHPHVTMTGFNTRAFVDPFRAAFPVHRVTRVDSALDMRADGLFESLWQTFDAIVERDSRMHSTADRQMPPNRDKGWSYTLGGSQSAWQCQLYEKGKERFARTKEDAWRLFFDVVRLEARVWPEKAFKDRASTMPAAAFWGCSPILMQIARAAADLEPEPVSMKETRTADDERTMAWIAKQAGPALLRDLARKGGDIDAWAAELLDRCMEAAGQGKAHSMLHGFQPLDGKCEPLRH